MKWTVDTLLEVLFEARSHSLYPAYESWLKASRRFREFSGENASKIRSKLRNTVDPDTLQDLWVELEIAAWLLNDKRFSLAYEEHGVRSRRGPDFVVTFTTKLSFGVEVTRLQFPAPAANEASDESAIDRHAWRIGNIIAAKLAQMNSDMGNLLVIGVASDKVQSIELDALMRQFRRRAQEKDEVLLNRSRLRSASDFFKHYQRLSAILLRTLPDSLPNPFNPIASAAPILWLNPEGRFPLLSPIVTALKTNNYESTT